MKVDGRKIRLLKCDPIMMRCLLMMMVCLSTSCSAFKESSLFKSKSSNKEKVMQQSSGQTRLLDYSQITQRDSSSFEAWILVEGDFSFHRDSGIKGEKALIHYFGKSNSLLQLKDSLIAQQDSSTFMEHTASQTSFIKTKEKKTWGYSWLIWVGGLLLGLWFYYCRDRKK